MTSENTPSPKDTAAVRAFIMKRRRAMDSGMIAHLSHLICERAIQLLEMTLPKRSLNIALYRAMREEIDVAAVAKSFEGKGHKIHFPRISDEKARLMEFVQASHDKTQTLWEKGPYGIPQPHSKIPAIDTGTLDIVITPGVAFGEQGERIGLGLGYYDRLLPAAPHALKVALVPEMLVFPTLPQNPWDQRVDWIITEKRDMRTPRVDQWLRAKASKETKN